MKKLMILGGSRYVVPVIETAHRLGVTVITADYLPDNVAHRYSDEYINVSVIDKEAVLQVAKERSIDGIISFACDPGVVTAAYVAEKMNLNFQGSYEAVSLLQDKGMFRQFLLDNGFNCPHAKRYDNLNEVMIDVENYKWPVIVKPVDSAGSKGVTKVETVEELPHAIKIAISESHSGYFIIEEFLTFRGYHSSTDVFTIDGDVKFITFSDQLFDSEAKNPYTPAQIIWPSTMDSKDQIYLKKEIQRLMKLLKMKTGIYNIETCVGDNGKPYIMEISPRGGGCKIAEIQKLAFGVDLIDAEIKSALGLPIEEFNYTNLDGVWCEMVIHARSEQSGRFSELNISKNIMDKNVKVIDLQTRKGDYVHPFTGANMAMGDMFLRFNSRQDLDYALTNQRDWLQIKFES